MWSIPRFSSHQGPSRRLARSLLSGPQTLPCQTSQSRAAYSSLPKRSHSKQNPTLARGNLSTSRAPNSIPAGGPMPSNTRPQSTNGKSQKLGSKFIIGPNRSPAPRPGPDIPHTTSSIPHRSRAQANPGRRPTSREYKSAARKWAASIIALPIFIVTSYFLFDRCRPLPAPIQPSGCLRSTLLTLSV